MLSTLLSTRGGDVEGGANAAGNSGITEVASTSASSSDEGVNDVIGSFGGVTITPGRVATGMAVACGVGAAAYLGYRLYYSRDAVTRRTRNESESKVIYLIRHGQSTFNAAYETSGIDPMLFDAPLSALGKRQVMELNATVVTSVEGVSSYGGSGGEEGDDGDDDGGRGSNSNCLNPVPEVVLVSPLTRALQTAVGSFAGTGIPIEVLPNLREHLTESCDIGRTTRELRAEFPTVNFTALLNPPNTARDRREASLNYSNASSSSATSSPTASSMVSSSSTSSSSNSLFADGLTSYPLDVVKGQPQQEQRLDGGGGGGGGVTNRGDRGVVGGDSSGEVWWYVDPEAEHMPGAHNMHMDPAEACRRDFMTYGFVEPEAVARRRVCDVLETLRRRPEKTIALVGHGDFFYMLAAKIDPRGEELWLENCGVASYTLPPLPPALRNVHVTRSHSPGLGGKGSAAA